MSEMMVLRLVHVLGGAVWVGAGLFSAFFLMPALGALPGPVRGQVMGSLMERKLFIFLPSVAIATILSGVRLTWILSGGFSTGWFGTGPGLTYTISGALAAAVFLCGILVMNPAGARMKVAMMELGNGPAPERALELTSQIARLQGRVNLLSRGMTIVLLISAAGMAIGRYVQ